MSNRFLRRLKKFTVAVMLFVVLSIASLWVTSWALEPQPFGTAQAPDPLDYQDAIIQVYGADVWGFRGNFAIHTWIATKAVVQPNTRCTRSSAGVCDGAGPWSASPMAIPPGPGTVRQPFCCMKCVATRPRRSSTRYTMLRLSYPCDREYKMWPGPNSNSFTAWIGSRCQA